LDKKLKIYVKYRYVIYGGYINYIFINAIKFNILFVFFKVVNYLGDKFNFILMTHEG